MGIICSVLGTLLGIVAIFFLLSDKKKFDPIIEGIDDSEYFIKPIFVVGFGVMQKFKIDIGSDTIQKKVRKLSELFGAKEARRVALYDLAAEISYIVVFSPLVLLVAGIGNDPAILLIGAALIIFLIVYMEFDKQNKVSKRHDTIEREFPHMASQMALLVNAGMPLREALMASAQKGTGILASEMQVLVDDLDNGIPDYVALDSFASRCGTESVRKFSSLVTQNIRKGSSELAVALMGLSTEIWRNRVSMVRVEGEKASTKLLIPILIIFAGILLMVVAPLFMGMSGM